jgi:hypothetical protein
VQSLDEFGILQGTDKCSLSHGYLDHYERILGKWRHEPITLIEIGVFGGASLRMWGEYFDHATIVGIDIQPDCVRHAQGRCEVEIGSQDDVAFMDGLGRRRRPDIVIDDGSHINDHIILTFRTMFPHLQPGGVYIVEDLHFHAGPGAAHHRGKTTESPIELFTRLATVVSGPGVEGDAERDIAHSVQAVEFFYGGVAVKKRPRSDLVGIARRRELVAQANRAESWAAFAIHLFNNTGDAHEAIECLHRAIVMNPGETSFHHTASVILERSGDIEGAIAEAEKSLSMNPSHAGFQARVAELRDKVR